MTRSIFPPDGGTSEDWPPGYMQPRPAEKVIHLCPPIGEHEMPCYLKPTTEMPPGVLLTLRPDRVTCPGPAEVPEAEAAGEA